MSYSIASKTGAPWQCDVADIGGQAGRQTLINDEGAVLEVGAPGRLHLPELLQLLHHIHYTKQETLYEEGPNIVVTNAEEGVEG